MLLGEESCSGYTGLTSAINHSMNTVLNYMHPFRSMKPDSSSHHLCDCAGYEMQPQCTLPHGDYMSAIFYFCNRCADSCRFVRLFCRC